MSALDRRPEERNRPLGSRAGLTLVELVIAMLILTVGLLGMAAGTGWMIHSVDLARLDTSRAAALQEGIERVRDIPYEALGSGQEGVGGFQISWSVVDQGVNAVLVEFVVVGPGRAPGSSGSRPEISQSVADTLRYQVNRP